jgi:hypothetical protein
MGLIHLAPFDADFISSCLCPPIKKKVDKKKRLNEDALSKEEEEGFLVKRATNSQAILCDA